jgi:small-conductance mechanosensitive channel
MVRMRGVLLWSALAFGQQVPELSQESTPVAHVVEHPVEEAQPVPVLADIPPVAVEEAARAVLPWLPMRGFWSGVLLSLLALSCVGLVAAARLVRRRLAPTGLLPAALELGETALRVLALFFGAGVLAAWIPANLAPLLPWVMVFGAAAVGWSIRDVAPDLMAWITVALEGRIRVGKWVEVSGLAGRVEFVGLRSTVLHDLKGREILVPNRVLIQDAVTSDLSLWPVVEVTLSLGAWDTSQARWALQEAIYLAPWVAPAGEPEISGDVLGEGLWRVRVRLLDGRYAPAFKATLRERALEILVAGRSRTSDPETVAPV